MYKIIFADVDGTLRNSEREITQRTKEDIEKLQKNGIEVVLCSGRPRCEVERISRECNASRYIISSNGAELYDYITQKVGYKNAMQPEIIEQLYCIADQEDCYFVMNTGNVRMVNKYKYKDGTEIIPNDGIVEEAYKNEIMQCIIIDKDFQKMQRVKQEIENINEAKIANESKCFENKKVIQNDSIYCDVVNCGTSKAIAANSLMKQLGIRQEESIAIGDSYNDIDLLNYVGCSVAMRNSIKGLKSKVDHVTDDNDLDGAAEFFEKLLNGEVK